MVDNAASESNAKPVQAQESSSEEEEDSEPENL